MNDESFPIPTRTSKQMIVLPYLSAIRFSGTDAGDFLHNQVSSDVLALENNESVFACYCEPKGRVLALMLVSRLDEDYIVIMSTPLAATVISRLKIYVMRSKVNIEVLDECPVAGIQPDDKPLSPPGSNPVIVVPGSDRHLLLTTGLPHTGESGAQNLWKTWELQQGITWLYPQTSGQFLPQWLGFDQIGAVNYRKGCYPGQEIVARTHYLGKVKRHPRLLRTGAFVCPDPLDKIEIFSDERPFEAIITDCAHGENDMSYLFVITRMDPDLSAEKFEYKGLTAGL